MDEKQKKIVKISAMILFVVFFASILFLTYTVLKGKVEYTFILLLDVYLLFATFTILINFPLAFTYNPRKYEKKNYQPTVSVIIPVYNEQDAIKETILAAINANYPKDKLEIIVGNDGSTDKSAEAIEEMHKKYKFTFLNFKKNRGKRHILYDGFKIAKGEIVAVMDSDTILEKDFIREIVKPFADENVGGVCGHTRVVQENWLSGIQEANYFIGFHLYKEKEAVFDSVTCLSGCGSAYRKSAVLPFLDEWLNQTFLGVKCTYGEDRGLTTLLMRAGWDSVYTPHALTRTYAPNKLSKLLRQRIRWKKSFLREIIWQSKFAYRRKKGFGIIFYTYAVASLLSPFVAIASFIILPIYFGWIVLPIYLLGILIGTALYTCYSKIYDPEFSVSYMFGWTIFALVVMQFLSLYAWLTINDNAWGTR